MTDSPLRPIEPSLQKALNHFLLMYPELKDVIIKHPFPIEGYTEKSSDIPSVNVDEEPAIKFSLEQGKDIFGKTRKFLAFKGIIELQPDDE